MSIVGPLSLGLPFFLSLRTAGLSPARLTRVDIRQLWRSARRNLAGTEEIIFILCRTRCILKY